MSAFEPGDIVRHRGEFLRSICWFTDVPVNGRVVDVESEGLDPERFVAVEWCDREGWAWVNVANIEKDPRCKGLRSVPGGW